MEVRKPGTSVGATAPLRWLAPASPRAASSVRTAASSGPPPISSRRVAASWSCSRANASISTGRPCHDFIEPTNPTVNVPGGPGAFTVGFVGSMKSWHGLPVLIEAFARLHDHDAATRLLLIGGGPEEAAVRT